MALYTVLVAGGFLLGHLLAPDIRLDSGADIYLRWMLVTTLVIYVLVAALPFVPAAEIGLGLMLMLGAEIALLVYACTVFALMLAYMVGRAVPARACAAAFEVFGLSRARDLILAMNARDADARLELLLAQVPARAAPTLLRHRYLTLAIAVNLPGNSVLGGGGGIALSAGISGVYRLLGFLATVLVAVAPVPLFFAVSRLLQ